MRRSRYPLAVAALSALANAQALPAVKAAETTRAEVMAKVLPAVGSIMPLKAEGGGSCVVFDPLGFVLTNYHCVNTEKRMKIGLPDGELYYADVLGVDPGSDLAVLVLEKRQAKPDQVFVHAELGDSRALLVGESVFAMGNPFLLATDFVPTVTWGIVSGTHRYQPGGGDRMLVYPDCIQVDAPVNPGNSGGPLFNMKGQVVGINGRISVRDRGRVNIGVGFAIASHQIQNFLADLMAGKHAEHGTLDMNAWFMTAPNDPNRRGVFVQALIGDSIVAKLGVGLGDEITKFNGDEVRSANQLASLVGVLPAGSSVTLGFKPKLAEGQGYGQEKTVSLELARLDTGSTREPNRIAKPEHRVLAARALARRVSAEHKELEKELEGAVLLGGRLVGGKPAFVLELKGEPKREAAYWYDGTPAVEPTR